MTKGTEWLWMKSTPSEPWLMLGEVARLARETDDSVAIDLTLSGDDDAINALDMAFAGMTPRQFRFRNWAFMARVASSRWPIDGITLTMITLTMIVYSSLLGAPVMTPRQVYRKASSARRRNVSTSLPKASGQ